MSDPAILAWLGFAGVALALVTLIAVPLAIVRLPEDYFIRRRRRRKEIGLDSWAWLVGKNLLGWLLILAGISMLVLPGQGILTILVGVMLANFPGKRRVERWLASRPRVLASLNWMRRKAGQPPFKLHDERGT